MDQSTQTLSGQPGEPPSAPQGGNEHIEGFYTNSNVEMDISLGSSHLQKHDELTYQAHDRNGRSHPTVDVAEILRRWTHALQRIHKQSLQLAEANDGEGPDLLQCAQDVGISGHADSLAATLSEHRQHIASIQVLNNQLKEVAPVMRNSITNLTEEVNSISSSFPLMNNSEKDAAHILNLKRSVRATALSVPTWNSETSRDSHSEDVSEHFFMLISSARLLHLSPEKKQTLLRSERLFSEGDGSFLSYHTPEYCASNKVDESTDVSHKFDSLREYEHADVFHSPPLLMDTSLLADCYEDLLAPLSEMDTAVMDH